MDGVYVPLVGRVKKPPSDPIHPPGRDRRAPWMITLTSPYSNLEVEVLFWSKSVNPVCQNYTGVVGIPIAYSADRRHILVHGVRQDCFRSLTASQTDDAERGEPGKWIAQLNLYFEVRDVAPSDVLDVAEGWRMAGGVDAIAVHADKVPLDDDTLFYPFLAVFRVEDDKKSAEAVCNRRRLLDSSPEAICDVSKLNGAIPFEGIIRRC